MQIKQAKMTAPLNTRTQYRLNYYLIIKYQEAFRWTTQCSTSVEISSTAAQLCGKKHS